MTKSTFRKKQDTKMSQASLSWEKKYCKEAEQEANVA